MNCLLEQFELLMDKNTSYLTVPSGFHLTPHTVITRMRIAPLHWQRCLRNAAIYMVCVPESIDDHYQL